jgi:hypothetical protein
MRLCQIIIQFFDQLLQKAHFKEAEHKQLCTRLFRIWLCRSAEHNLPLLSESHQDLYIKIVQTIDSSADKALVQLERLTNELKLDQEKYQTFRANLLKEAEAIITQLIDQVDNHISKEEAASLSHTFDLIKKGQLPAAIK